ncbi:multidrug resistance protein fnx1 [Gaeumannomyces tritici R3-111a-1]|uniref:Multidrug resistance protein fnx1 n=1 Tax=Gaeumannomyces tritici (strain R3-111a-1) TaxID=644352 RepID=J3NKP6_GAET3|nr:multidrug resistance protein fnx1 [Gaeumannomyces tritici R3-111a-1]EJT81863.1 multidrug resistance protein fnx1 [Gaeumannomyces tritici R3-111a-1]
MPGEIVDPGDATERSPLLGGDPNGGTCQDPEAASPGAYAASDPDLLDDGGALERVVSTAEDTGLPGPAIGGGGGGGAGAEGGAESRAAAAAMHGLNMKVLIPAIGIGVYLCALDQLLAVATYARIGSDLEALNSTSWIATAYFLTLTSFQPLYGKLSDIFGRKECLLFSYLVFGLGCLGCGLAQDMNQMIIARAIGGIGGGGMNSVVSILLTDLVPLRERGLWQGYINIIFALGTSTGAPLGGLLADSVGWRWSFIGQTPICLVAFIAVYVVLKLPRVDHSHWREKLAKVDFLGAACLIAAVFCLLLALDSGPNQGWGETSTVAALAATPVLFAAFILVEVRVASHPFAPGHIIFDRSLFACYACNFFGSAGQMAVWFFLPLLYQTYFSMTAVQAGIQFIPGSISGVCGSLGAGFLIKRTGRYYWLTVASHAVMLSSCITLVLFSGLLTDSKAGTTVGLSLMSFGVGAALTTTLVALISNAAQGDTAVVIACSYLFRSLGSAIGVSLMSALLQQVLRMQLAARLGDGDEAARIGERVRESLDFIKELGPELAAIVRDCYRIAVSAVFGGNAVPVGLAFAAAFYIREKRMAK